MTQCELEEAKEEFRSHKSKYPAISGLFSVIFFVIFAIKTPMQSKLYAELFISPVLGFGLVSPYLIWAHNQKVKRISDIYNGFMEENPRFGQNQMKFNVDSFEAALNFEEKDGRIGRKVNISPMFYLPPTGVQKSFCRT